MSLQAQPTHLTGRCRSRPAPCSVHSRSRHRRVRCRCSLLPSEQLQQALAPPSSSKHNANGIPAQARAQHSLKNHEQLTCQAVESLSQVSRREAVVVPVLGGLALQLVSYMQPQPAEASKLGATADAAWEAMGGGPADLTFPESW